MGFYSLGVERNLQRCGEDGEVQFFLPVSGQAPFVIEQPAEITGKSITVG